MTMRDRIKAAIGNGPNYERDADTIVDAVLDAMREPTPDMVAAGRKTAIDQSYGTYFPSNDNISELFIAMMRAAKDMRNDPIHDPSRRDRD